MTHIAYIPVHILLKTNSNDIIIAVISFIGILVAAWFGVFISEKIRRRSIVKKYKEFIGYSAWTLQERINNILKGKFASYYNGGTDDVYSCNALNYTVFLFCQFFAWREIINREMYNFKFSKYKYDTRILGKLIAIEHWFSTDKGSHLKIFNEKDCEKFMIFRGEQRVLGDICVSFNEKTNLYSCIGFSDFIKRSKDIDEGKSPCYLSIKKLEKDIEELLRKKKIQPFEIEEYKRLMIIRNSLLDLLDILDSKRKRHPECRKYYDLKNLKGETNFTRKKFHESEEYLAYKSSFDN